MLKSTICQFVKFLICETYNIVGETIKKNCYVISYHSLGFAAACLRHYTLDAFL